MAGKYKNIVRAVFDSPWAILPEKLAAMTELLELRAAGDVLSEEQIAARIGTPRQPEANRVGGIGVISIFGVISKRLGMMDRISGGVSTDAIGEQLDAMLADPNIRAIVLQIESPGGSVFGVQELADKIREARNSKKIVAIADSFAASAAYWIASAASELVIAPGGQVGSIGVYRLHTDTTAADEKEGVKYTVVRAAEFKAEAEFGPLTEAAKESWQAIVDDYYDAFVGSVAKGRNVSAEEVRRNFGKGRMVLAADAVKFGMADRIGTFASILDELGSGSKANAHAIASGPAFQLKGITMNPNVFGALVRLGMVKIDAMQEQADAALARFCAVKQIDATDEKAVLAALEDHIATPAAAPAPAVNEDAADGDRATSILTAVRLANVADPMGLAQKLIADKSLSVAQALRKIDESAVSHNQPAGAVSISHGESPVDKFKTLARDSILSRAWGGDVPKSIYLASRDEQVDWKAPSGKNNSYALQSLKGLGRETLAICGVNHSRLSDVDVARIVMGKPLSDFGLMASDGAAFNVSGMYSNILYDAANVMLRRSYMEANTTYQSWMKQGESLVDFKPVHKVIAGELADPRAIPEDGEFEDSSTTDGRESYSLTVWGRIFSISWQAVVNDRLSAFTEIPTKQGRAMKRKQNRLAYGVLKDNAALSDGGSLFNSTAITAAGGHNNLATGAGAPSVTTLNTLTAKMMRQKGLDTTNSAALNLMPHWLIAPAALRGTVLELLGSTSYVQANGNSGVKNIWQNGLEPVFDEELGASSSGGSDTAWYLAAHNNDIDTVEYAYLQGLESPALDQEQAFNALAIRFRIYQAFAVKALDYRGLQKHAGG